MNLTPPESAKNNAKKALRWRKEHPEQTKGAGTSVGWTRANQLARGGELSPETVKRMAQFNRHRKNAEVDPKYKDEPWKDNGYLMWLAWGGTSGVDWAIRKVNEMKRESKDSSVFDMVRKVGSEYFVFNKEGTKKLSRGYQSKEEAEKRLGQIEYFKHNDKESISQGAKFAKVMREFEEGNLKSSSGKLVTSRKQAEAIAASEAGISKDK